MCMCVCARKKRARSTPRIGGALREGRVVDSGGGGVNGKTIPFKEPGVRAAAARVVPRNGNGLPPRGVADHDDGGDCDYLAEGSARAGTAGRARRGVRVFTGDGAAQSIREESTRTNECVASFRVIEGHSLFFAGGPGAWCLCMRCSLWSCRASVVHSVPRFPPEYFRAATRRRLHSRSTVCARSVCRP